MPWTSSTPVSIPDGDSRVFTRLLYASSPLAQQAAIALTSSGISLVARRRVAFYYPVVVTLGRTLYGPGQEMAGAAASGSTPLHVLTYTFVQSSFITGATEEQFGVAICGDRGIKDIDAVLWRYT